MMTKICSVYLWYSKIPMMDISLEYVKYLWSVMVQS